MYARRQAKHTGNALSISTRSAKPVPQAYAVQMICTLRIAPSRDHATAALGIIVQSRRQYSLDAMAKSSMIGIFSAFSQVRSMA